MYIHLRGVMDSALGVWDTVIRSREYCKFGNFREGLFSRNFAEAEFRENNTLRNGENSLSFTDIGKACQCREFFTWQICLLTIFAKIKFRI